MVARTLRLPVVLLIALFLYGCPKSESYNLYNHSGADITVRYTDADVIWKQDTVLHLADDELNRIVWVRRDKFSLPVLDLKLKQRDLRYELVGPVPPTREYVADTGGSIGLNYQLEPDQLLYLIKPSLNFPADISKPQPPGYPINPQ